MHRHLVDADNRRFLRGLAAVPFVRHPAGPKHRCFLSSLLLKRATGRCEVPVQASSGPARGGRFGRVGLWERRNQLPRRSRRVATRRRCTRGRRSTGRAPSRDRTARACPAVLLRRGRPSSSLDGPPLISRYPPYPSSARRKLPPVRWCRGVPAPSLGPAPFSSASAGVVAFSRAPNSRLRWVSLSPSCASLSSIAPARSDVRRLSRRVASWRV